MKKEERIACLLRSDVSRASYQDAVDGASTGTRRTRHCMFCLLNLLFLDEFSTRFARIDDTPTRAVLDSKEMKERSRFWLGLTAAYCEPRDECNNLIAEDELFGEVDPSIIAMHDEKKLFSMWREVNSLYNVASGKFRQSGTHVNDFKNFVAGRADVLYLRHWLSVKPGLNDFVSGGLLPGDEYDLLSAAANQTAENCAGVRQTGKTTSSKSGTPKPKRHKGKDVFEQLASTIQKYVFDREAEMNADSASAMCERADMLLMLENIRKQIKSVESDIPESTGLAKESLAEELELLLDERRELIQRLRKLN